MALAKQVIDPIYFCAHLAHCMIQIKESPQASAYLETMCEEVNVIPKRLVLWIKTRWASLAQFLERFLYLRKV
jgi:hypothetical protein